MGTGGKNVKQAKGEATVTGTASVDSRDYAFAPGKTGFDKAMRNVLSQRPKTILINEPLIDSLTSFIKALSKSPLITHPIRHLIVASHANPEGVLQIPLDLITPRSTYEDLEAVHKTGSIRIPADALTPRPKDGAGNKIPPTFNIKGCRIGLQPPFLQMLKKALGGGLTVTAPKHFHATSWLTSPAGPVEYMKYSFTINRPRKFGNRKKAIKEFAARGFTLIDGNPVPKNRWDKWIPKKIHKTQRNLNTSYINPVTKKLEKNPFAEYRYHKRKLARGGPFSIGLRSDPGTYKGRKKAVRDALLHAHARYRDDHPLPEYVRFGYNSMDEFMDGWQWKFTWRKSDNTLFFQAIRHEYTVIRPIVDPATNQLFLNFYPSKKKASSPLIQLREDDNRFFATV